MATYRNKNDDTIFYGGEFKLNISMDVIDEQHMEDVDFLCTFNAGGKVVLLTKEDMIEVDADNYLAPLDSNDFNKGYGYNIENGGNSVGKMSEETKLKISLAERGKKMSEEAKQKMKGRTPWNKGRKCTLEERLKTQKANPNKKKVICLTTNTIYESIAEAGRQLNINKHCIRRNCMGKYNYAGNHLQFRYLEEVQQ